MFRPVGKLTINTFERQLEEHYENRFTLEACGWTDAYGLVALTCAAVASGNDGWFDAPADDEVRRYHQRMHLPAVITRATMGKMHQNIEEEVREQDRRDVLAELVIFGREQHSDVGNLAHERLGDRVPSDVLEALYQCLIEACSNVVEHAQVPTGYCAAQVYRAGHRDEHIVIGIGDVGVGVAGSLALRFGDLPDVEALRRVLAGGTTESTDDPDRGYGISDMAKAVRKAGGILTVRSGGTIATVYPTKDVFRPVRWFPGTLIGVDLPCR